MVTVARCCRRRPAGLIVTCHRCAGGGGAARVGGARGERVVRCWRESSSPSTASCCPRRAVAPSKNCTLATVSSLSAAVAPRVMATPVVPVVAALRLTDGGRLPARRRRLRLRRRRGRRARARSGCARSERRRASWTVAARRGRVGRSPDGQILRPRSRRPVTRGSLLECAASPSSAPCTRSSRRSSPPCPTRRRGCAPAASSGSAISTATRWWRCSPASARSRRRRPRRCSPANSASSGRSSPAPPGASIPKRGSVTWSSPTPCCSTTWTPRRSSLATRCRSTAPTASPPTRPFRRRSPRRPGRCSKAP